ncbi:glycosyltransferase involved in cell wall biosynthesis [Neolewinella xylanilytica]|uniref:Glycosyltransferase involved in cell wall biosynthesis n=2 Tax=Neolewinella xylanilytica TaxID=1514080 RepID=A0A2S6I2V2_9BACT|nr:glycosyltransferase involved in cell wall biosynthesis [Neolewinella xylanilytica]
MRIAVNTRFLQSGELEGIGYFTQEVCERLPDLLPDARFLFCFDRPYDPRYTRHERVEGMRVFPPARDPILWDMWFEYFLPRAARTWRADVLLHLDGYCSLRTSIPQVMVIHDIAHVHYPAVIPKRVFRYYQKRVPAFLKKAERVITVSEYIKQDILREYGLPVDKIGVAGNGVKAFFLPLSAEEKAGVRMRYSGGRPYFFYLGAVHPRKNVERLIQAYTRFRELGGADHPLLLGGRLAWQTKRVRMAHRTSPYNGDITFLGYRPEREIAELLGSSLALVYPSLSEGFGVPLLEAMHAEVPILTSNRTSLPEVGGRAAYYVDPENVDAIAGGLMEIAVNAGLRERLVEAGRERRGAYSWDNTANTISDAVKQLYPSQRILKR